MPVTAVYYLAFAALGLVGASLGPTLQGLADQTGAQLSAIGFLFTARAFGYLIGAFFGGRVYDRMSGNPIMGFSLVLMGLGMAAVPVMPMLWLLTSVLFFIGLGEGVLDVGGNTLIVWKHRGKVGPYMNGLHFFFGMGSFLSPIIVARMVLRTGGIASAYWFIALLVLPVGLWLMRLKSPSRPAPTFDAVTIPRSNNRYLALVVVFFVLYVGAEVSYAGWVFTFAVKTGLADKTVAAYLTSGFWVAFTAARLVSIPAGARLQPRTILLIDFAGALASLAIILLRPESMLALWAGSLGFGFFIASIFPTMLTYAGKRIAITGKVTGYFFLGATVGSMSLPWLIGQLIERAGPISMMWVLVSDMLLAVFVLFMMNPFSRKKGKYPA